MVADVSRLFFALWPDDVCRGQIASAVASFPRRLGRPVSPANLHITLVFLGNVEPAVREALVADTAAVRGAPFDLILVRSGWWQRARVAWLAPESDPPAVAELVASLQAMARRREISVEDRPYRPHLTFARKVRRLPPPLSFAPIHWQINEFCLVESVTQAQGSRYTVLHRWPLTRD